MTKLHSFLLSIFISVCALSACTDNDFRSNTPTPTTSNKEILVLFAPGALGDYSYNDLIYKGLVETMIGDSLSGAKVNYYNPASIEEVEKIISAWKQDTVTSKKKLLVLANSSYKETLFNDFSTFPLDTASRKILLFESKQIDMKGVHTFNLSLYGTSFISGAVAEKLKAKPLVLLADSTDTIAAKAIDGFADGFEAYGGKRADIGRTYLEGSSDGYNMADSTYKWMHNWTKTYNFILPIIGGSAKGVFRYMREKPTGLYTVGIDVDQSSLCSQIVGSMTKKMDTVLRKFLQDWAAGKPLPKSVTYGLRDGYTDWVTGRVNLTELGIDLEEIKAKASQSDGHKKESEYEKL